MQYWKTFPSGMKQSHCFQALLSAHACGAASVATLRLDVSNNIAWDWFRTTAHWRPIAIVDAIGTSVEVSIMVSAVL